MKNFWTAAALLGLLASVACGDRDDNVPREAGEAAAPAVAAPATPSAGVTSRGASASESPATRSTTRPPSRPWRPSPRAARRSGEK